MPKELEQYFPPLPSATASNPAPSIQIDAALYIDTKLVGIVKTSYQYQTRGATRKPERRVTGNLTRMTGPANADDYLLIERSLENPLYFRFTLLTSGTAAANHLFPKVNNKRWGPLDPLLPPSKEIELAEAKQRQTVKEHSSFSIFDDVAVLKETHSQRLARSKVFQRRVATLYSSKCAVCGDAFTAVDGKTEIEAAHIVPRSKRGADDARNGLALCRSHHWAFDRGLFGIGPDRKIHIPHRAAADPKNQRLLPYLGKSLHLPSDPNCNPHPDAFAWHLRYVEEVNK